MWKDWVTNMAKIAGIEFLKILHLQREKAKKGFVKSPNVAKIAKVTEIFLAKWKDWVTNVAKIARITNLTKIQHLEREKVKKILKKSQKYQDFTISKIFLTQSVNDMQWRFKFRRLTHSHLGILRKRAPLVRGNAFNFEATVVRATNSFTGHTLRGLLI